VFEAVHSAIAVTQSSGTVVYANDALARLTGRPAAAIVGSSIYTPFLASLALRRSDDPREDFVVWSVSHAQRHHTEQALAHSESKVELAVWGTQVGFWDLNTVADEVHWWNDWCASIDLDPCEGPQHRARWNERIHPTDNIASTLSYERLIEGSSELYEAEYRVRTRAGGWHWVLCRGRATARDGNGRVLRTAGVMVDIDARKRAELALRETEVRLETAVWGGDIGLWDRGADGQFCFLNNWCERVDIDYPSDGRDQYARWRAQIHPEDAQRYAQAKDDFYRGGADQYDIEYRVRTRRGEWRWLLERGKVLSRDSHGSAERIVGACIDVDVRRRADELLRTQAKILETMREGVVLVDLQGCIELTNPAFERMFRCKAAELIGSSIAGISASSDWLERLRNQPGTRDIAFRRRDGTSFTGEVLIETIVLAAGKKWLAVVQDVSERKRLEREVLDIGNRERRRIGHELHDGLCQELTGVALMLRSIATHVRRDILPTDRQFAEIVALVNSAIEGARTMARGLSPVTIDRGGLLSALDVLVCRARASSGVDIRLHVRMPIDRMIAEATASHLYRIAQEALSNAVKHAAARIITVALEAVNDDLQLTVSDNGQGLAEDAVHGSGMGLKIMDYRARMIGGYVEIAPRGRGGTRVRCIVPTLHCGNNSCTSNSRVQLPAPGGATTL
jgi:PAS domain S-box-containing protein